MHQLTQGRRSGIGSAASMYVSGPVLIAALAAGWGAVLVAPAAGFLPAVLCGGSAGAATGSVGRLVSRVHLAVWRAVNQMVQQMHLLVQSVGSRVAPLISRGNLADAVLVTTFSDPVPTRGLTSPPDSVRADDDHPPGQEESHPAPRRLTVELSPTVLETLGRLAREEGLSRSTVVNRAIQVYAWVYELDRRGDVLLVDDRRTGRIQQARVR
jgi:hypothetical protein